MQSQTTNAENRELSITRTLNAPRKLVWEVWTKPEHIKNWWGPEGFKNTIHKMDFREGGSWEFIMHGPDGTDYKNKNVFKEIIPMEKIVFEHMTGPIFTATITFRENGDKTIVTMHALFESPEQLQQTIKVFKADVGQIQTMARLEAYLLSIKTL